ncbi:intermediate filament protein B-like [Anneissia japonica]|uniref:intermediate filament protein B-like n=1 Tax=Anneissia japonica TaxID=1529436 RepID=UPI00142576E1|nr:intermediate filament protein B-like [Anneissia japonica]
MRLKILDEQVNYYKKRLSKEESRLQQAREEILKNNNEAAHEKQKKIDDLSNENKILGKENARLKHDLTNVRQVMEEQKADISQIQTSAYDNDVKQREMQWKVEQLTKELTMERDIQDKLEKSCDEKDLKIHDLKKELTLRDDKKKIEELRNSRNDGHTSDQSTAVDLEHMMKDLSSEIKSAMKKSAARENDSDDKKKNNELEMKVHILHMQRLADMEKISQLQGNLKDVTSKLERKDHETSSRNIADRTSPNATDICQALARAQVRAYAMSLNETPLYQFESSNLSGLQAPGFSFTSPNMRTSTPNRSAHKGSEKKLF